jgi:hypothetical protein
MAPAKKKIPAEEVIINTRGEILKRGKLAS